MARRRAKAKRPPLSAWDRFLYGAAEIALFVLGITVFFLLTFRLPESVTRSLSPDAKVIFNDIAFLTALPPAAAFFAAAVLVNAGKQNRQPIFGNRRFKKPFGVPFLPAEPLFSKAFWRNRTEKQREKLRKSLLIWGISSIVCLLLYLPGLYPRVVFTKDWTMERYNSFNQRTEVYEWEELQQMEIRIKKNHRSSKRAVDVTFVYREDSVTFGMGAFQAGSRAENFRKLIERKNSLPEGKFQGPEEEDIQKLIRNNSYNKEELALIFELIDYEP